MLVTKKITEVSQHKAGTMIRAIRLTFSILLVAAVLASELPLYSTQDANRDSRVDLSDAILTLQNLMVSAENAERFIGPAGTAISTVQAAAGLGAVITSESGKGGSPSFIAGFLPWLSNKVGQPVPLPSCFAEFEPNDHFISLSIPPPDPPPRIG